MNYQIRRTSQFKKNYRLSIKRGLAINKLDRAIELLAENGCLPQEYSDHQLAGNKKGLRECHIEADWLLLELLAKPRGTSAPDLPLSLA